MISKRALWFAVVLFPLTALGTVRADSPNRPILFPNPAYTVLGLLPSGEANHDDCVTAGDVNRDGLTDLAILSEDTQGRQVSILLGSGGGVFTPGVTVPGGMVFSSPLTHFIRLADIDGDGDADLIQSSNSGLSMHRAAGNGTFLPPTFITGIGGLFEPADIDGDGDLDLLFPSVFSNDFPILRNPGNGEFGSPTIVDLPGSQGASPVRVVNLNDDAYPDLLARMGGSIFSFLGTSSGGFSNPVQGIGFTGDVFISDVAPADFNGDGRLDVAVKASDRVAVFVGDGTGHWTQSNVIMVPSGSRLEAIDFDRDGDMDLAEEYSGDPHDVVAATIRLLRNQGGVFEVFASLPADSREGLLVSDVDRDGRPDLIAAASSAVGLLLNRPGPRLFGQRVLGQSPGGPVFIRDLNQDGRDDLLAAGEVISFFPATGSGGFGPQQSLPGASNGPWPGGHRAILLDSNGDGHLDAAMASASLTSVAPGGGDGTFGPVSDLPGGERHDGIVAFDLGLDGDTDIALACEQSGCILESSSGDFAPHWRVTVPGGFKNMVGGDLNGDGLFDLAGVVDHRFPLFESNSGQPESLQVMLGQPDGFFAAGDTIPLPPWQGWPVRLGTGDLNADDRLDMVFYAKKAGVGVLFGTGDGHLAGPVILPTAGTGLATTGDVLTADLDADGHLDIAVLERFAGTAPTDLLEIFLGDGTGVFPRHQAYTGLDVTGRFDDPRLAIGELDGDGWPDLALASETGVITLLLSGDLLVPPGRPIAAAGTDQFVECTSPSGGVATLDGAASSDPDSTPGTSDDIVAYAWSVIDLFGQEVILGTGPQIAVPLGMGEHLVTLRVTDEVGLTSTDDLLVTVGDTTPPVVTATSSQTVLWPPNHRMVPISIAAAAVDLCGAATVLHLQAVGSSEPDDAPGDGDGRETGDIRGAEPGGLDLNLELRAERDAGGAGRVYTLTYRAVDGHGNVGSGPAVIGVPHDLGGVTEPLMLRVEETEVGTRISWDAVPGARWYNLVGGFLDSLRALPQVVPGAGAVCLGSRLTGLDNSGIELQDDPPAGEAFFFLVEYDDGQPSGYGTASAVYDRTPVAPPGLCP